MKINFKLSLALCLMAFVGFYSCKKTAEGVVEDTTDNVEVVVEGTKSALDEFGNFVWDSGEETEIEINDSTKLTVGKLSTEYILFDRINGDYAVADSVSADDWFHFTNVNFETGNANISETSKAQLENVSKILAAYPNVEIKVGGYTDNTGSEEANVTVSQNRADAVKAFLASIGVDESRVKAEGFGPQFPVCPENDTDTCKAMNRRVDVRITKK